MNTGVLILGGLSGITEGVIILTRKPSWSEGKEQY